MVDFPSIYGWEGTSLPASLLLPERNETMTPSQLGILAAAALVLLTALRASARKRKERKQRDFTRKLELVLQPRESVKVVCPQKKGRCILTNQRVLFDTHDGFTAVPLKTIKKVQGTNEKGNRTTSPANMVGLTIKAEQEYVVKNDCEEFVEFAKQLLQKTAPKKPKTEKPKK